MTSRVSDRAVRLGRYLALRGLYASFSEENSPEARARKLLREWLSSEQRDQFDAHNHFDVVGGETGRRYRIAYGCCANVRELDSQGDPVIGLCFVPDGHLQPGDVMLAQKIALETIEIEAVAKANRFLPQLFSPVRRPVRRQF